MQQLWLLYNARFDIQTATPGISSNLAFTLDTVQDGITVDLKIYSFRHQIWKTYRKLVVSKLFFLFKHGI